jgi:hypothetical protein
MPSRFGFLLLVRELKFLIGEVLLSQTALVFVLCLIMQTE